MSPIVLAPAFDLTVVENRAGMEKFLRNMNCGATSSEVDGIARCGLVGGVAFADLSVEIPPPALEIIVVKNRAGVYPTTVDFDRSSARSKVNSGGSQSFSSVTHSKLPIRVVSPTL